MRLSALNKKGDTNILVFEIMKKKKLLVTYMHESLKLCSY